MVKGVSTVSKAVPTKTTMPILECILIDASTDFIKLTGNDMELGIETSITGKILERGIIAVKAKTFSEIVRKLPDSDITIETTENNKTIITCEKIEIDLDESFSGEDFSYLPTIEKTDSISITEFTLKEIIRQTIFSISDSDTNKMMTGELFEIEDNTLKVVSLDGHRISIRKIELSQSYPSQKVIVPGKTLQEISKIIKGDADSFVEIYFTGNNIVFEFDNTLVVSRLIEGNYFNIEQMLSNDYETKITVSKRDLLSSIDRSTLLIREGDKKPIIIDIIDDLFKINIRSSIGQLNEELTILKEGRDLKIGFNPRFLMDALRVIDEDEVDLYFMNSRSPCFIKDEAQTFIYLILPVNFSTVG